MNSDFINNDFKMDKDKFTITLNDSVVSNSIATIEYTPEEDLSKISSTPIKWNTNHIHNKTFELKFEENIIVNNYEVLNNIQRCYPKHTDIILQQGTPKRLPRKIKKGLRNNVTKYINKVKRKYPKYILHNCTLNASHIEGYYDNHIGIIFDNFTEL